MKVDDDRFAKQLINSMEDLLCLIFQSGLLDEFSFIIFINVPVKVLETIVKHFHGFA